MSIGDKLRYAVERFLGRHADSEMERVYYGLEEEISKADLDSRRLLKIVRRGVERDADGETYEGKLVGLSQFDLTLNLATRGVVVIPLREIKSYFGYSNQGMDVAA